ncbi:hypothetical protein Q1695_009027 [Nippostrongylus brasiliensis]|nr:hypothetical protein Q1695_009027 [Nippostrongylus brasiliensis]
MRVMLSHGAAGSQSALTVQVTQNTEQLSRSTAESGAAISRPRLENSPPCWKSTYTRTFVIRYTQPATTAAVVGSKVNVQRRRQNLQPFVIIGYRYDASI